MSFIQQEMNMNITINDDTHEVPSGTTIADLLVQLEMKSKYVAVERNLELIPRAEHANCLLTNGDKLEIVTLVGGG